MFNLFRGADVNSHDSENTTPLIAAASNSNTETVDCLLKCNVDITVKDSSERTALFWAAEENAMETLQVSICNCIHCANHCLVLSTVKDSCNTFH